MTGIGTDEEPRPDGGHLEEGAVEEVIGRFHEQLAAMVAGDTAELADLLTDDFTLTHMTGYVQPKAEWLRQMDAGQFDYQDARDVRASAHVAGETATVDAFAVVPATVYGSYAAWRLHFQLNYVRQDGIWLASRSRVTTSSANDESNFASGPVVGPLHHQVSPISEQTRPATGRTPC